MNNFKYVSCKEVNNAFNDLKENRDNAVFIFTKHFGRDGRNSKDKIIQASYLLHKTLREQFADRVTCPIYINEPTVNDYYHGSMVYDLEIDDYDMMPSVCIYENGELKTHYIYTKGDDLTELINKIKKL